MIHRVLMVSPHFPPDSSAGTHRVRLLAAHLARHGWEPTVLSVDPRDVPGRLDPTLEALVPAHVRVIHARAWPERWTRRIGIGDLGLRALPGLWRRAVRLLRREAFQAIYITTYPIYPALLGPALRRRFALPFVLDYQDPWVGAWGQTVGPGPHGEPDLKSRLSRLLATRLEPRVLADADAVTAVSAGTLDALRERTPARRHLPSAVIPIGGEPADFAHVTRRPRPHAFFDPTDGQIHGCVVGTLLPLGFETLRAVCLALADLRAERPLLGKALRLHFLGTSNRTDPTARERARPVALEHGLDDCVTEVAPRLDYLDALTVQTQASFLLLLGSSEPHYTPSRLYPALLAKRPVLAAYHAASSAVEVLRRVARPPSVRLVTYDDRNRALSRVPALAAALGDLAAAPHFDPADIDPVALAEYGAEAQARRLAALLDEVSGRGACA